MKAPRLMVREHEKTPDWIKDVALWLSRNGVSGDKSIDIEMWRYYHNLMNKDRFDYFLKIGPATGGYILPAKPRHIPLQRHLINLLTSELLLRPRSFNVRTINSEAIEEKQNNIIHGIIGKMFQATRHAKMMITSQMTTLSEKLNKVQELASAQPETVEEQQQVERIKAILPSLTAQIEFMQQNMKTESDLLDKEAEKIDRYYKMDYTDMKEEAASILLKSLYSELRIKDIEKKAFISNCVTGKHMYFVDQLEDEVRPRFESIDSLKVYFPKIDGIDKIQDGPWVIITEAMSYQSVSIEFGDAIVEKYGRSKLEELEDISTHVTERLASTPEGGIYLNSPYSGADGSGIKVVRVYFKSPRREEIKYSPNPHEPGTYFRHFINPITKAINEDLYTYDPVKQVYVSKENPQDTIRKQDASTYSVKKGQFVEYRYTNDLYEAVIINDDIIVHNRKKTILSKEY